MKTGYFGNEYSHTYACAAKYYGDTELIGYKTIAAAVRALSDGDTARAVVPIENSVGGTVGECIDSLKNNDVYIAKQHVERISHSLIALAGAKKEGIKRIYSHPQALSQCDGYLKKSFPSAEIIAVGNTAEALRLISSVDEAAIARAPLPGEIVLDSEIEDVKSNFTRFVVLETKPAFDGKRASIMFDIKHRPGALLEVLTVLAESGVNMNKLESRPARDGEFKYWFYVEFECENGKPELAEVMERVARRVEFVKFLGSY